MSERAHVATKRDDFNFFAQPLAVVWDLVSDKTLAGAGRHERRLQVVRRAGDRGREKGRQGAAELGLTAWPGKVQSKTA